LGDSPGRCGSCTIIDISARSFRIDEAKRLFTIFGESLPRAAVPFIVLKRCDPHRVKRRVQRRGAEGKGVRVYKGAVRGIGTDAEKELSGVSAEHAPVAKRVVDLIGITGCKVILIRKIRIILLFIYGGQPSDGTTG